MGLRVVSAISIIATGCGRLEFNPTDGRVDGPPGVVPVSNLAIPWTTPHGALVTWAFSNDAMLDHFEVVVGPTQDAVITRDATARVIGPADRPELATTTLPNSTDRADHTIADELAPDSPIWVRVIAVDRYGGETATAIVHAQTKPVATGDLLLFDESIGSAFTLPSTLVLSSDRPYMGSKDLEYIEDCVANPDCYENLRVQGGGQDFAAIASFSSAYFEVWVANAAATPSYWSDFRVRFGCGAPCDFSFHPLTIRSDGNYHRVEIPLAAFASSTGVMTASALAPLLEWGVGGRWEKGAVVRLDEVHIRW